jgi:hypothetical protein
MIEQGIEPQEDPTPSVEALITVWKTVLSSTPPVVGVRMPVRAYSSKKRKEETSVDVIAKGGEEWIKIYRWAVSALSVKALWADPRAKRCRTSWRNSESKTA